ncbi:zinc ribbon domain-containing protein [Virgibacillus oceani]|uniref:Zinc-ribbon domain-containing protein n=1 Tax=Virgibacillus oceani TaxID=1479511 RepID=A0A917H0H0_9BACI|nr:hypothetical protein [Virgibacillus oceani]GGG62900.1 hypothetical protein GCM10011398_02850 [Virgibacillus oceani]
MECKNCGYQTNDDKKFCPECGNQLTKSSNDPTIKKPLSKKVILIASIAAILSLSCIVFYFIGKGKFQPENKLQNFEQAIEDKNTDKLQKLLSPVNDSFDITKENTANFIKYLNSNPQKYDALLSRLTQQAESMSNSGENEMAYLNDTYATLNMIKEGKKWLLFDDYQIIVTPMYLDLYMDTKDVELYVDGNKVGTSTGKDYHEEFGPFMPGIHEIKATFKNPYAASSVSDEVELFDSSESKLVHTLELEAEEVTISSIYDDAALFVDGKKTDITVGPEEKSIGMFPTNESVSIYVEKEFPWGTAKSEEVYINSNHETFDTIYPLSKENQDEMLNQLNETLAQYAQALTKRDASVMKDGITDKLKNFSRKDQRNKD